jgi:SAM-dependent methyltransferase
MTRVGVPIPTGPTGLTCAFALGRLADGGRCPHGARELDEVPVLAEVVHPQAQRPNPSAGGCLPPRPRDRHDAPMGLAQQFGHPRGLLGAVVGRGMARGNADLSRWVVQQAKDRSDGAVRRVAELGPGPGVGLQALLAQFDEAHVWGVDLSSVMLAQARKRNQSAVATGRLTLLEGDTSELRASEPADLVMANHVVYFWRDPVAEMSRIRGCLRAGGLLALGYQLKHDMPVVARKRFPPAGHQLYETVDELTDLVTTAGFTSVSHAVKGSEQAPEGRVVLAVA